MPRRLDMPLTGVDAVHVEAHVAARHEPKDVAASEDANERSRA